LQSVRFLIAVFEFVLLIFSLSVHECAHAWTASFLGDQTARMQGRVTLNPVYHVDPFGSLLFPALIIFGPLVGFNYFSGVLIGWAKPTPIITRNFRRIVRDDNITTLAGPASNLLIAFVAMLLLAVISVAVPNGQALVLATFRGGIAMGVSSALPAVVLLAILAIEINLSLFFFNLLPIPPLDGSRLIRNILPYNAVQTYDRIPIWVSYLFMVVLGRTLIGFLVGPAMGLSYVTLQLLPGR
jgi:Zn-dependent protease